MSVTTSKIDLGSAYAGIDIEIQLLDESFAPAGSPFTSGLSGNGAANDDGLWLLSKDYDAFTGVTNFAGFGVVQNQLDHGAVAPNAIFAIAPTATNGSGSVVGDGDFAIDHDGGTGAGDAPVTVDGVDSTTDILQYLDEDSAGLDNVTVSAYLKSDYDAGNKRLDAQTKTGSDGRWIAPLMLDSGTYYIIGSVNAYQVNKVTVVVP